MVHGEQSAHIAEKVTSYLTGNSHIGDANVEELNALIKEIPTVNISEDNSLIDVLVKVGLASSNSEARRLIEANAISINSKKVLKDNFEDNDFVNDRAIIRRGKAYKDSALVLRAS